MTKKVPSDIRQVYNLLKSMIPEMPTEFGRGARGIMQDLVVRVKVWYGGGIEPDWDEFRNEMDELCYKFKEPFLFGSERGEYRKRKQR